MNDLKIFEHEQFGRIRTTIIKGEPWFVANDICGFFGEKNRYRTMQALDKDEKGYTQMYTPQGIQSLAVVNEPGLYQLLLMLQPTKARGISQELVEERKNQLKLFKRWIAHEILPSIRRNNLQQSYETIREGLINPHMIIRLASAIIAEQETSRELSTKVAQDKPKVAFAEAVDTSRTSILIGDLAKLIQQNGIPMGQNRLFEWMRINHYLIGRGERRNMPTQRSLKRGLFEIAVKTLPMKSGTPRIIKTTKVTGKGQVFFINLFLGETA